MDLFLHPQMQTMRKSLEKVEKGIVIKFLKLLSFFY